MQQHHQAVWIRIRQGAEQHRMEHREDGGGGSDADRERQDTREGESGRMPQRPQGEPELLEHAQVQANGVPRPVIPASSGVSTG